MSALRLEGLACAFPGGVVAVDDVSLEIAPGELFCLLGPSGCGKSTLLRLIGGYLPPQRGRVWLQERDVTAEPPEKRPAGMVFQSYALFPHLSALENVAFGLRVRGVAKAERLAKANEMLDWVGLTPAERGRRPAELSGGQQQRVALARALAFGPKLLMLDEPFANLDRILRERLREELKEVQRRAGIATILVTHDREEALGLGDRVGIMGHGRLLQVGTPEEVYHAPVQADVARFLGHRNLLRITRADAGEAIAGSIHAPIPAGQSAVVGGFILVWPELVKVAVEHSTATIPAIVRQSRFAGSHRSLLLDLENGNTIEVPARAHGPQLAVGDRIYVEVPPEAVIIVRRGTGELRSTQENA
jgi:ABC-type Fe3+/spermidine/putrescine transport system ATPase subunit